MGVKVCGLISSESFLSGKRQRKARKSRGGFIGLLASYSLDMQPKQRSDPADTIVETAQSNRSVATRTRHVSPLLPLAALTGCTCWFAGKLALALLRRQQRLGQQSPSLASSPAASVAPVAHLPELANLDVTNPAGFFLPDPTLATLADCFAMVQGVRLPLHSQVSALAKTLLPALPA